MKNIHRIARSEVGDSVIQYAEELINEVCDVRSPLFTKGGEIPEVYDEAGVRLAIGSFIQEKLITRIKKIRSTRQADSVSDFS